MTQFIDRSDQFFLDWFHVNYYEDIGIYVMISLLDAPILVALVS